MKTLLITLLSIILFGCATKQSLVMTSSELSDWKVSSDSILFKNKVVAIYDHQEYELNPAHHHTSLTIELSIIQVDGIVDNSLPLVKYIHTMHPNQKVEIVIPNNKK